MSDSEEENADKQLKILIVGDSESGKVSGRNNRSNDMNEKRTSSSRIMMNYYMNQCELV